jgi:hypothetical protein
MKESFIFDDFQLDILRFQLQSVAFIGAKLA